MPYLRKAQLAGYGSHYMYYPFEYFLQSQQELGFQTIEMWCGAPHYLLNNHDWQSTADLKKAVEDHGLSICAFTPESSMYNYLISSSDPIIQKNTFSYYNNAIQAAAEIGCRIVPISCCGGKWNEDPADIFDRTLTMLKKLAPIAEEHDVLLAVDTLPSAENRILNSLNELNTLLKEINSPAVKACMDLTSVGMAGETMEQWFELLGQDIVHIHFSDGRPHGRLAWGDGLRPLEDCLQILNKYDYQGHLGLKTFDGRYLASPREADQKSISAFEPYFV